MGGVSAFREICYAAGSWTRERRVVVRFQMPETKNGAAALFAETFFFVTNHEEAPGALVEHYLLRGKAERCFGDIVTAFRTHLPARRDGEERGVGSAACPALHALEAVSPEEPIRFHVANFGLHGGTSPKMALVGVAGPIGCR